MPYFRLTCCLCDVMFSEVFCHTPPAFPFLRHHIGDHPRLVLKCQWLFQTWEIKWFWSCRSFGRRPWHPGAHRWRLNLLRVGLMMTRANTTLFWRWGGECWRGTTAGAWEVNYQYHFVYGTVSPPHSTRCSDCLPLLTPRSPNHVLLPWRRTASSSRCAGPTTQLPVIPVSHSYMLILG